MPAETTNLSISDLRSAINGQAIDPTDAAYDEARKVFRGAIDRRPAVIVRAAGAADVAHVVSLARETGLELAVRSGGHSPYGTSDGGILLDLSAMRALEIDVEDRTAWAETGMTAGEYTAAVGAHGLATGFGDTGSVGIGGLTLGGGVGFLVRKHGLTIDNLLAAEVVTGDGQLVRADDEQHPDLFWAIRGGGGNFGVATRFKFRLHEVDSIVGGMLLLPATPDVIASVVAEAEAAPEELSAIVNIAVAPPVPFIPAEHHGKLIVAVLLAYAGPAEAGERAVAPFRAVATPLVDGIQPMSYPALFRGPERPKPVAEASRTLFIDTVDRDTAATILDHLQASTAPVAVTQFRVLGGAVARVPSDATAFAHRQQRIMAVVSTAFERVEDTQVHNAWVGGLAKALNQGQTGAYVNFEDDQERIRDAYPGPTWDRLTEIKARYDPTNVLHLNLNIPPATS